MLAIALGNRFQKSEHEEMAKKRTIKWLNSFSLGSTTISAVNEQKKSAHKAAATTTTVAAAATGAAKQQTKIRTLNGMRFFSLS